MLLPIVVLFCSFITVAFAEKVQPPNVYISDATYISSYNPTVNYGKIGLNEMKSLDLGYTRTVDGSNYFQILLKPNFELFSKGKKIKQCLLSLSPFEG